MEATRTIPLALDEIGTPVGVAVIGAWMLYPDDETERLKIIRHFEVRHAASRILESASGGVVSISAGYFSQLVEMALEAASASEVDRAAEAQNKLALGAGVILHNACLGILRGDRSPVTATITKVGEATVQRGNRRNSNHAHEAVWRRFKSVSAFWAAWLHRDDGHDTRASFPCEPEDMADFLSLAEAFRALGETTTPPRRRAPVLPAGTALRLPENVLAALLGGTLTVPT